MLALCAGVVISSAPALAETPTQLSIKKFETSYTSYKTSNSWMWWKTDTEKCGKQQTIYGARPANGGSYPVLIYLHGTFADWGKNKEGQRFVELAAAQGFIAVAMTYSSSGTLNEKEDNYHANCIFNKNFSGSGVNAICKITGADCSKLLVTGFSQGGIIAAMAKNYNSDVKAVWGIGLNASIFPRDRVFKDVLPAPYGNRALPNNKLVINMGEASNTWTKKPIAEDLPSLKQLTGVNCGSNYDCLQPNGNGYYVVSNSEIKDGVADHAYWMKVNPSWKKGLSFTFSPDQLDPGFQPPATTQWSMIRNLDWLRSQL